MPSAEILLSENFMLRLGYNFRRRQEMVLADKPAITGLSFGVGLRVSKFHISYGYSQINLAGISNTITLAVRFADFNGKGSTPGAIGSVARPTFAALAPPREPHHHRHRRLLLLREEHPGQTIGRVTWATPTSTAVPCTAPWPCT